MSARIRKEEFALVKPVNVCVTVAAVAVDVAIVVHTDTFATPPVPMRGAVWISYPVIVPLT